MLVPSLFPPSLACLLASWQAGLLLALLAVPCLPPSLPPGLPASLSCLLACLLACPLATVCVCVPACLPACLLVGCPPLVAWLLACLLVSCRATLEDRFLKKSGMFQFRIFGIFWPHVLGHLLRSGKTHSTLFFFRCHQPVLSVSKPLLCDRSDEP